MRLEEVLKTSSNIPGSKKAILSVIITAQSISDEITEVLKPFELSSPQFNVLRILRGQKGKPANLNTIQERMISKMSNTTRLVDKLLTKGLVERIICEKNRRKVEITITDKGLKVLSELDPLIENTEEKFVAHLSDEEKSTLTELLEKMRK
ncbi:MAG: MarR family transcriptional regulator [Gillisia sp.]